MNLLVNSIIGGTTALSAELAQSVRSAYGDSWRRERVVLDFAGVTAISPSFLSHALAPILEETAGLNVEHYVEIVNLPSDFSSVWRLVCQAALVKYGRKP